MYPLPKISECIDVLAGCEYFSCLDMVITRSRWRGTGIRRHLRSSMGNIYLTRCRLAYQIHQKYSVEHWDWFWECGIFFG